MTSPNLLGIDSVAATSVGWRDLAIAGANGLGGHVQVVGFYGNGRFANGTAAKNGVPHAEHYVAYDVNGTMPECDLFDIEPLDGVPAQAHSWAVRHNRAIPVSRLTPLIGPGFYCSASIVNDVEHNAETGVARMLRLTRGASDMLDAGFKRSEFVIQSAHYGWHGGLHICGPTTCGFPQADATQCEDHAGTANVDLNLWGAHCFRQAKPVDPDARYGLFDNRPRLIVAGRTERGCVFDYDHYRATQTHTKHPNRSKLYVLRVELNVLHARLASVVKNEKRPDPTQIWRLHELAARASGMRLV